MRGIVGAAERPRAPLLGRDDRDRGPLRVRRVGQSGFVLRGDLRVLDLLLIVAMPVLCRSRKRSEIVARRPRRRASWTDCSHEPRSLARSLKARRCVSCDPRRGVVTNHPLGRVLTLSSRGLTPKRRPKSRLTGFRRCVSAGLNGREPPRAERKGRVARGLTARPNRDPLEPRRVLRWPRGPIPPRVQASRDDSP